MIKTLPFAILLIFGLSSIASTHAKSCEITYFAPDPPQTCEVSIDEDGNEVKDCWGAGGLEESVILNNNHKYLRESSFNLDAIRFSGSCSKCRLQIWSRAGFRGSRITYPFNKSKSHVIFPNRVWSKPSKSFKVSCRF